ncbi:MAG: hypothetical protein WBA46_08630 [Thermomicrobiales bacterium]
MRNEDFIFIDGQAVRLTSVTRDGDRLSLVVIVRGSGGRDEMQALLGRGSFEVTLGDDPARRMQVAEQDLRSTGTGPTAIHRFAITLEPATTDPRDPADVAEHVLAAQLARIERKLDAIIARLDAGGQLPF